MSVSIAERLLAAYNAGFRNTTGHEALSIAVAISLCECAVGSSSGCETGCNPDCCCGSCDCSQPNESCGIWQIFQPCHPNTAACASNYQCCAGLAWQISHEGTSFGAWSTYNNGCYATKLSAVRAVIATMPPPIGPQPPPPPPACHPACDSCSTCQGTVCVSACPEGWLCAPGGNCLPPIVGPIPPLSGHTILGIGIILGAFGFGAWALTRSRPVRAAVDRVSGDIEGGEPVVGPERDERERPEVHSGPAVVGAATSAG